MLTQSKKTITASSTEVLAANFDRSYLYYCNDSSVDIWLKFGADAVVGEGFCVKANGGYHSFYGRDFIPEFKGTLNAISESGSNSLSYAEGSK